MFDFGILNKMKQLVPLLSKLTLFELGIILFIIFSLCKTDNFVPLSKIIFSNNGLFSNVVKFSYLIILLGILRKTTAIDLSHNFTQNSTKNIDAKFLHVCELKMISTVQIPCEVVVGVRLFKLLPDFIIDTFIEKFSLYLTFDYFSDQIDLDVYSYGINSDEIKDSKSKRNKKSKKVLINNHIGKSEFILPILILPKVYEDGKELLINLRLEPANNNKLFYILLLIFSYLSFPRKKMLIIS